MHFPVMDKNIDDKIISLAQTYSIHGKSPIEIFKRFLDDIFSIFKGTTKNLHILFDEMNYIHETNKKLQ